MLKAGLAILKSCDKSRQEEIIARRKRGEKISDADDEWLDYAGNHVEKDVLLNALGEASDYDHALIQLDADQRSMLEELEKLGREIQKATVPNNRENCMLSF